MSLTASLLTASSGLQAAQASLRAVSDNIANVNTPGYVRKAIDQQPLVVDGRGMGVPLVPLGRLGWGSSLRGSAVELRVNM